MNPLLRANILFAMTKSFKSDGENEVGLQGLTDHRAGEHTGYKAHRGTGYIRWHRRDTKDHKGGNGYKA